MPQFIVLFEDDDAHADQRLRHMAAHLAFLETHADAIIAAGPLIDPASAGPGGGLWVVQADHVTRIEALSPVNMPPTIVQPVAQLGDASIATILLSLGAGLRRVRLGRDIIAIALSCLLRLVLAPSAVLGDNPFAKTPVNLHEVKLQMNRFSGALKIDWYWHQVRDYRPLGAIRAVKKRYSDHKSFTADCDLMKKRLF